MQCNATSPSHPSLPSSTLVLRPLRNPPRHTTHNRLRRPDILIPRRRELVHTPINTEAGDRAAGCGDVRDAEVVDHGCEGVVEGDGLRKLGTGCADEGEGYAVGGGERGGGGGEGGGECEGGENEEEGGGAGVHGWGGGRSLR